jgi:hypothetical protein
MILTDSNNTVTRTFFMLPLPTLLNLLHFSAARPTNLSSVCSTLCFKSGNGSAEIHVGLRSELDFQNGE